MDHKICFNLEQELVDNLNVVHNTTTGMIAFWNKYQIFLINEKDVYISDTRQLNWLLVDNTDFIIHHLILSNNHLLCLDYEGNLFAYSFKLKHKDPKRSKNNFQLLEHNILSMDCDNDFLFCIKLIESGWYIQINKMNLEFQLLSQNEINKDLLLLPNELNRDKLILRCYIINENKFQIILSIDKLTMYAKLLEFENDKKKIAPIKLLTCPSEINSINILKEKSVDLIISLNSGTVIKLPMSNDSKTPKIVHLNTAIHKFLTFNCKVIYTDGITMWISTNIFSEPDAKLRQLFVKHVKDFIKIDNRIFCTTYSKLVYIFNLNDESSYLVPLATDEYSSAEHLLNNISYLNEIMKEVKKNDEVIDNIKKEEKYITTLALSNRQDIMNKIIQYNVNVYESYEDIVKESLLLNLTSKIEEYFDNDSFYFLIKIIINNTIQENYRNVSSAILSNSKMNISILSEQKLIKTITVKVLDQSEVLNIVVPLSMEICNSSDVNINIKIMKDVPKVLDSKENLWITLHSKQIIITPEHFIKTNHASKKTQLLKTPEDTIENLLYKTANRHHGHLFRITKVSDDSWMWSFYVKLPSGYKEILQNKTFYKQHFDCTKAKFFIKEMSSEEFLKSKRNVSFYIVNDKVDIDIISDRFFSSLSDTVIKVSCVNPLLALGIRNFFSNLAHNNFLNYQSGQEFLSCAIFSSLEQIENAVKKCIDERLEFQEFFKVYEQYQRNICAVLI